MVFPQLLLLSAALVTAGARFDRIKSVDVGLAATTGSSRQICHGSTFAEFACSYAGSCQLPSLPLILTFCPYFCSFVISWSPCLTTSLYCLFLSSERFVSITPFTRSTVQDIRSPAMKFLRSLYDG